MGVSSPSSTTAVPKDFVPTTYSEMFEHYYSYIRFLVVKSGIDYQNAEDVAMGILASFFERDVLSDFDPEYSAQYVNDFSSGKALFRTFLSGFVLLYVRHYRQRQAINKVREPLYVNTPVADGMEWGESSGLLVLEDDDHLEWHTQELVASIRQRLATVPVNTRCSLHDLFEACLRQVEATGGTSVADLALEFDVGKTTMRSRMTDLRAVIDEVFQS